MHPSLPKIATESKFVKLRDKTISQHSSSLRLKSDTGPSEALPGKIQIKAEIQHDLIKLKANSSNYSAGNRVSTHRIKLLSEHIRQMKNMEVISEGKQLDEVSRYRQLASHVHEAEERLQLSQLENECLLARKHQHRSDNLIYKERIMNLREGIQQARKQINQANDESNELSHTRITQQQSAHRKRAQISRLQLQNQREIGFKRQDLEESLFYEAKKLQRIEKNISILYQEQQAKNQKVSKKMRKNLLIQKFIFSFFLEREEKNLNSPDHRAIAFRQTCALYGSKEEGKFVERFLNEKDLQKTIQRSIEHKTFTLQQLQKSNSVLKQQLELVEQERYRLSLETSEKTMSTGFRESDYERCREVFNRVSLWTTRIADTLECREDNLETNLKAILAGLQRGLLRAQSKEQRQRAQSLKLAAQRRKCQTMIPKEMLNIDLLDAKTITKK